MLRAALAKARTTRSVLQELLAKTEDEITYLIGEYQAVCPHPKLRWNEMRELPDGGEAPVGICTECGKVVDYNG
jgi:hypothetical protein